MFREMRKSKRAMSLEESIEVLNCGIDGVLGTISENGYPYAVPVNYVYYDSKIYFHSATEGEKISNILNNDKVSFTVVTKNKVLQSKFTTDFQSVILFGRAKLVQPSKEILFELIKKYSPDFLKSGKTYVEKEFMSAQIVEISIEHLTGKERK